jgi:hypothetical protein
VSLDRRRIRRTRQPWKVGPKGYGYELHAYRRAALASVILVLVVVLRVARRGVVSIVVLASGA